MIYVCLYVSACNTNQLTSITVFCKITYITVSSYLNNGNLALYKHSFMLGTDAIELRYGHPNRQTASAE